MKLIVNINLRVCYRVEVYVDTDGNVLQKTISTVNTVESGNLHSVTSNAVAESIKNMNYLFPIRLEMAVTSSASWQQFLWLGVGFLDKYLNCPNINGKTKKVRLVMTLYIVGNSGVSVLIKREDNVEQIVVDNRVVWGGVSADAFGALVYVPIDPSFIDAYSRFFLKSSIEGIDVGVSYIFAEVYYE